MSADRSEEVDDITLLNLALPPADNSFVDERWILIDRQTGLHVGWYFWLRLLDEVGRSDRYGTSFGLLLLEAGGEAASSTRAAHEALARVSAVIRGTDLGGVIAPDRAGVILTQQEPEQAEVGLKRIVGLLESGSPVGVNWNAELFCYPRDAAAVTHLLTQRSPETLSA